ncbi:hypothetical protein EBR37_03605 [bacterium]|nr:hypothetical protein [bacterium]
MSSSKNRNQQNKEMYDPAQPVCNTQDDFNQAIQAAIKYNNKEAMKKAQPWALVCMVIWFVFFIWALVLAMKLPVGKQRVEHILFAILFSPAYVLATYLSEFSSGNNSSSRGMGNVYSTKYG